MADLDQPLRLHPLTYLEEEDEVTVGRADINSFGLFPPDGAALLRQLEAGHPPNEAARWYSASVGMSQGCGGSISPGFIEVPAGFFTVGVLNTSPRWTINSEMCSRFSCWT